MQKRFFAALLLMGLLVFSSCGSKKPEKLNVEKLLSNDYELEYIFSMAGLTVDNTKPITAADGGVYYPVNSDKYKTTADIKKLLESTYSEKDTVDTLMTGIDAAGRLLYMDIEGKLYRSSEPITGAGLAEADYETVEKQKAEKGEDGRQRVLFTFDEMGKDGSEYSCTMEAVECKDGKWRLRTSRGAALHELTKQGPGQSVAANVKELADSFVQALAAGDTATIEQLTQAQGGSYSYLSGAGIVSATITGVVEELDFEGEYLLDIEVSGGDGTFPEGKSSYRIKVGYSDYEDILIVRYLKPAEFTPYDLLPTEQQTNVAANQVTYLMRLAGKQEFAAPAQLPTEIVTEYALWLSEMQSEPKEGGMPLAELQAQVMKYFGIEGFDPGADSIFYNADTDSYFMLGRGLATFNMFVEPVSDGNGVAVVKVTDFDLSADPLMLKPVSTTVYTLNNNWNGSYTFVSGIKA